MKYKVNIELNFDTQAEAQDIMNACEPLVVNNAKEQAELLATQIAKEVKERADFCEQVFQDITKRRADISQLLADANAEIDKMRQSRKQSEALLDSFKTKITQVVEQVSLNMVEVDRLVHLSETETNKATDDLIKFQEYASSVSKLKESIALLRDMVGVFNNVVTGGRVAMSQFKYDRQYGGECWQPVKSWTFAHDAT